MIAELDNVMDLKVRKMVLAFFISCLLVYIFSMISMMSNFLE